MNQNSEKIDTALKESEEWYRDLVEHSHDLICVHDFDGKLLSINKTAAMNLGYTPDELLNTNMRQLLSPEVRDQFDGYLSAIRNQKTAKGLMQILTKSGEKRIWEYHNTLRTEGIPFPIVRGLAHDITDRIKIEKKLKRSEERYRRFFEEDISGTFISTPEGRLVACNSEFARIFGFSSPEEALKADLAALYPDAVDRTRFLDQLRKNKSVKRYESEMCKNDGTPIFTLENSAGIFDEKGNLIRIVGFIMDITGQKSLEAQLQQAKKMEAIGTLTGGIAHNFNNILSIILGNAELAISDLPEWNPATGNLNEIRKACIRAKDLVRQLLIFSRKSPAPKRPVQIDLIIKESLELIRSSIPNSIEIRYDAPMPVGLIKGDPAQLHQILIHLCSNAADAMENHGGFLHVSVHQIEIRPEQPVKDLPPGPYVRITVKDSGIGMPQEVISRIFDPYFTTKEFGKGTGMGLAVVYGIVKAHEGAITVESSPGKGTSFDLFFPSMDVEPGPEPEKPEAVR
ncbi:MAG: PAS domain S-box protein [Thermodesulfobacteriota bacterium]